MLSIDIVGDPTPTPPPAPSATSKTQDPIANNMQVSKSQSVAGNRATEQGISKPSFAAAVQAK